MLLQSHFGTTFLHFYAMKTCGAIHLQNSVHSNRTSFSVKHLTIFYTVIEMLLNEAKNLRQGSQFFVLFVEISHGRSSENGSVEQTLV